MGRGYIVSAVSHSWGWRKDFFSFKIHPLKSNPAGTGTKSNSDISALLVL